MRHPSVMAGLRAGHPREHRPRRVRVDTSHKGGHDGLWDLGKSGAKKYAVENQVYQEAYSGQWWKYSVKVRGKGISDYQFRAPGEWFSELYSAYYLGAISKTHADYKWFTEQVHKAAPDAATK